MTTQPVPSHPVIACAHSIEKTLESVADVQACFMSTTDKQDALLALARIEAKVAELKLRVLAVADDVAEQTGARDAGGWLAHHTNIDHRHARAELGLAKMLVCGPPFFGPDLVRIDPQVRGPVLVQDG